MLINAHKTLCQKVAYKWHPLFGQKISVHVGAGARKQGVLHCDVSGRSEVAGLAIPIWMFDPSICDGMRIRRKPFVEISALEALRQLLTDTIGCSKLKGVPDGQDENTKKSKADGDALVEPECSLVDPTSVSGEKKGDPADGANVTQRRRRKTTQLKGKGKI